MASRDRTDPHRSAQSRIFKGAGENQSSLLHATGGKPGSDVGNTQPMKGDSRRGPDKRLPRRQKGH